MMRILVNDGMAAIGQKMLEDAGHEVITDKIPQEELAGKIGEFDAIVVRSATKVRKDLIDAGKPRFRAVVRGGVGIDNIDHVYAGENGVKVMNTPAASSPSVAELAIAHMFAISRHVVQANLTMRKGEWNKKQYKGVELGGKTLGVLGIGRIGQSLAQKAMGLGMKVIAYDPFIKSLDMDVELMSMDEVLAQADYISLHMPAQPDGPAIGTTQFGLMKDGAFLINCARGGVVDEAAMITALDSGKLAGAGVDVFVGEPKPDDKVLNHPKISVTPHIGASTGEAQDRIGIEVASQLIDFFK
ncbi:MAG: D-2-hydroxyacid dehydrogenase [Calditrichaeota bacterium]|nr:D-2-hydroxyacid dehydrogenase [Calditrichota bacterium]